MDLAQNPLWSNLLVFAAAAILVWQAGTRVAEYADELGTNILNVALIGGGD